MQDKEPQVAPAACAGAQNPVSREDLRERGALRPIRSLSLYLLVICLAATSINASGQTKSIPKCDWPTYLTLNEDTSTAKLVDLGKMEFNPGSNILDHPEYFNLSYVDTSNKSFFYMQNRKTGSAIYSNTDIVNIGIYPKGNVRNIIIQNWPTCVLEEVWFDSLGNMGSRYHCNYKVVGDCYLKRYENGKLKYVDYFVPISMLPADSVPPESQINEFRAVGTKSGYYDDNGVLHYR